MPDQGFPLYARRVSDGTVWIVTGWQPAGGEGIPVLVPVGDPTDRARMQPGERFTFSPEMPTRLGGTDRAAELVRQALHLSLSGMRDPEAWAPFEREADDYLRRLP